jgi:hypothetical protein
MAVSWQAEAGATATVLVASVALLLAAAAIAPPSAAQQAAADPVLALFANPIATTVGCALLVAALWWWREPPDSAALGQAWRRAALGATLAMATLSVVRVLGDGSLPSFLPDEESARPGLALGLAAGILEESTFRFALLAPAIAALRRREASGRAVAGAVAATALAFAAAHEIGPGAGPFDAGHFLARLLIAGGAMSWVFVAIGPGFLLGLHVGAHVVLALAFVAE